MNDKISRIGQHGNEIGRLAQQDRDRDEQGQHQEQQTAASDLAVSPPFSLPDEAAAPLPVRRSNCSTSIPMAYPAGLAAAAVEK